MTDPDKRKRVLVIEDDQHTNLLISDSLGRENYDVHSVFDGESGIKAAKEKNPDLIVLDLMMPGIDGWEVCRRLREPNSKTAHIPIMIVSVVAKDGTHSKTSMGPITLFNKPFHIDALLGEVERLINDSFSRSPASSGAPKKVLVIDDEAYMGELLKITLEAEGFVVDVAEDGPSGLACAQASPPDLVSLDVHMPNMSGLEVCRQLRLSAKTAELPILILSAFTQRSDIDQGMAAGATVYLTKPFNLVEYMTTVRKLLKLTA